MRPAWVRQGQAGPALTAELVLGAVFRLTGRTEHYSGPFFAALAQDASPVPRLISQGGFAVHGITSVTSLDRGLTIRVVVGSFYPLKVCDDTDGGSRDARRPGPPCYACVRSVAPDVLEWHPHLPG